MPAKPARPTDLCYEVATKPPGYRDKQATTRSYIRAERSQKAATSSLKCKITKQKSKLTATVDVFLTGKSCKFSGIY